MLRVVVNSTLSETPDIHVNVNTNAVVALLLSRRVNTFEIMPRQSYMTSRGVEKSNN